MSLLTLGRPNPKQRLMLEARTKHVGFGGARGGGKSWAVRTKAVLLALRYPGIKILIVRRSYPELINNHINILRAELAGVATYNDRDKVLWFPAVGRRGPWTAPRTTTGNGETGPSTLPSLGTTGAGPSAGSGRQDGKAGGGGGQSPKGRPSPPLRSTIHFMYCAKDGDLDRLQGVEYDVIFLDEATQLSEYQMKTITACLRGVNDFPKRVYYTCNPGGQGHSYIKRIFIDRRYEAGEHPEDYTFIRSLVTDNRVLMASQPDYVRQLEALPEKLRRAWLLGDWDIFEGQFFEDFRLTPDPQKCAQLGLDPEEAAKQGRFTHVIAPFDPPRGWKLYRSFDWGYSRPFSCGWWAVDYDGRLYRILELYGCTKTPNEGVKWDKSQVFREIRRIETQHPWLRGRTIEGVADPAIWDQSGGESIAETAERYQVYFSPGDHSRVPGWMQCHYRLAFDREGIPMMYVFDTCKAFLRTVPLMVYDANRPEDLDTSLEDHVCDEWRYLCMARPIKPTPEREEKREMVWGNPLGK